MSELSETQLLLLSNLIYLDGVVTNSEKPRPVSDTIHNLLEHRGYTESWGLSNKNDEGKWPAYMTEQQWLDILEAIKNDPQLMNLTITNCRNYTNDGQDATGTLCLEGMRVACFVDGENATVVIRGTATAKEWGDNADGGYKPDTTQQKAVLSYIENELGDYEHITVTGHSKGGNEAQYVTILSDKIDRCVSFDGQGFCDDFLIKYRDKYVKNRKKITSVSARGDFVNTIMYSLVGGIGQEIYIDTPKQDDFLCNHCPNVMLKIKADENGKKRAVLREAVEHPDAIPMLVRELSQYAISNIEEKKLIHTLHGIMGLFGDTSIQDPQKFESLKTVAEITPGFLKKQIEEEDYGTIMVFIHSLQELDNIALGFVDAKFGIKAELAVTTSLTALCPGLFSDDLINALSENIQVSCLEMVETIKGVGDAVFAQLEATGTRLKRMDPVAGEILINFTHKNKETWDRLSEDVQHFIQELPEADRLFEQMGKKLKKFASILANVWNESVVSPVKQSLDKFFNCKEAAKGRPTYSTSRISIEFEKLLDLQAKTKSFERDVEEVVALVLKETGFILSEVSNGYSEVIVQHQINAVYRVCDEIRESRRQVSSTLQKKTNAFSYAQEHYKQMEVALIGKMSQ